MPPDIPEDVALLAGPQLFGHLFNYGLFGILTSQVYFYHLSFPNDPTRLKILIYLLYSLECVQIVMATYDAYQVLGAGWGNTEALDKAHLVWFDTPLMTGIVSAIVQCYFSWRIYILSTSAILSGIICLIAFAQGCAAIATGIMSRLLNDNARLQEKTLASSVIWLVGSAVCDILIALCMLYFLSRGKGGTVSDVLLSRLIHLTVETGSLTASVASIDLILFVAVKHSNLYMTPALMLTKVYTNTLLMLINNRARMRTMMRRESANLNISISPRMQWMMDPGPTSPTSPTSPMEPPDGGHELVTFRVKTPIVENYPDIAVQDGRLQVSTSRKTPSRASMREEESQAL